MGVFGKKKDPIKDREKNLVSEIKQLEDQIRALQGVLETARDEPKVRQTAYPGGTGPAKSPGATEPVKSGPGHEMVFEPVDQQRLQSAAPKPFKDKHDPRALQREGSTSLFERVMRYFRGPTSANPKLVSYLAAGNIHGLQPLRYERRVARNRLLLWIVIIIVLIVGLLKMLLP
jgi:hypothetical protein